MNHLSQNVYCFFILCTVFFEKHLHKPIYSHFPYQSFTKRKSRYLLFLGLLAASGNCCRALRTRIFSLEDFTGSSFGVYQGEGTHIKIWFHPDIAGYIKEKIWHESQQIHPQDDGSIIFEADVAGTDEIRFWIMTWGSKAEVLEPASLREEIRTEAETMASRYGAPIVAEESPSYSRPQDHPLQHG